MKLTDYFPSWFRRRKRNARPARFFHDVIVVGQVSDVPEVPNRNFYIVQRESHALWAVFECPCGTGHLMRVNLSRTRKPYWSVVQKRNTVSLSPSIWLQDFCRGHYWINDSRIYWAATLRK